MDKTKIEWTDATWNPIRGCSKVTDGCRNCYAEKMAARFCGPGQPYEGVIENGRWNGNIRLVPEVLDLPLRWKKPRRIFVNSMSDLFHPNVPDEFIDRVFAVMALAPQHTFQILTKRPERMKTYLSEDRRKKWAHAGVLWMGENPDKLFDSIAYGEWPLPNVWLGVSVENQRTADERIPLLLQTPAAVRFLSCEPLLGPVSLWPWLSNPSLAALEYGKEPPLINWIIVGGESGPGARPMHPDWVRSIRDQCVAAGVPFFFKQWGEWKETDFSESLRTPRTYIDIEGNRVNQFLHDSLSYVHMVRIGKKHAGRMLDGRTWDEYPVVMSR